MRTAIIDDVTAFAALGPEWDGVLSASAADGPYLRHAWLLAWWRAFGAGRLAVVTCRDDATGELLGALPLYACSIGVVGRSTALRLMGDGSAGATGVGAFARRDREEAVTSALCDALEAPVSAWDSLDLHPIATDDPFATRLAQRLGESRCVSSVRLAEDVYERPRINLPTTWDAYLMVTLSHHQRRSIRRSRRHAEKVGATVELVDSCTDLAAAIDDALALHQARMRFVVSPRYATTAARRSFFHEMLPGLLAEDRLRLSFLVVDGERVACECQMRYRDTRYAMWAGFLAEHACNEVSKTLFGHTVESAIAEGCTALDFGLGNQQYKRSWGASDVPSFGCMQVYASSLSGRLSSSRDASFMFAQRRFDAAPKTLRDPLWRLAQRVRALARPR